MTQNRKEGRKNRKEEEGREGGGKKKKKKKRVNILAMLYIDPTDSTNDSSSWGLEVG